MNNILKMRTISKIVFSVVVCTLLLIAPACNDILNVETERVLYTEDNKLNKADDQYYSAFGILRQFAALGEKYVILGELQADLMDVTINADVDLQAINNHSVSPENPYISTSDFYAVINNCNYYIQHADTSVSKGGFKVLYTEYALIKAIRAWTYFQLAINYGQATWLEQPILSLADANENHPTYDTYQIIDALIADLIPYVNIDLGASDQAEGYTLSEKWFVPVQVILGDLFLWKGQYEAAATLYYTYIRNRYLTVTQNSVTWDENFERVRNYGWPYFSLESGNTEALFGMTYSVQKGFSCGLMNKLAAQMPGNMYSTWMLKPSQAAKDNWKKQTFTYYVSRNREIKYTQGDLRGGPAVTINDSYNSFGNYKLREGGSFSYFINGEDTTEYINKFVDMNSFLSYSSYYSSTSELYLYRASTLYLRYAEAVNRLGKPTLAFAILKYGLNQQTQQLYVDPSELTESFTDFSSIFFGNPAQGTGNRSIRYHGVFNSEYDTTYVIPSNEAWTKDDTIRFVEDKILEELALETAFEGNRYGDLIRFSDRRNDPSILADAVGRKNPALKGKLMSRENWFLPTPK